MNGSTYTLRLITPCFCAGADQSQAELRTPSIRGELRWWLRAIGADANSEAQIFGCSGRAKSLNSRALAHQPSAVTNNGKPLSSAVQIRVCEIKRGDDDWSPPIQLSVSDPLSYILYFIRASNAPKSGVPGPRWDTNAFLPANTTFKLVVSWRRLVAPDLKNQFELALRAWSMIGTLGYRSARGFGAIQCVEFESRIETLEDLFAELANSGFSFALSKGTYGSWLKALGHGAYVLKNYIRSEYPAKYGSPIGWSAKEAKEAQKQDHRRQQSPLRLRPVFLHDEQSYRLLLYEPPLERILCPAAERPDRGSTIREVADKTPQFSGMFRFYP